MQVAETQGLRLLALDNGGIRGLSELLILNEIMLRIKIEANLEETPNPCHYFDLIGGSGSGGLIALMLGRLEMSVDKAIPAYVSITQRVFSEQKRSPQGGIFKASVLEAEIKKLVQETCGDGEARMRTDKQPTNCKTFVCAAPSKNIGGTVVRLFRSYNVLADPTYNCTVWEAVRATSAAPELFKSIALGEGSSKEIFIDGGLGHNNPAAEVIREAKAVFGAKRQVACVVSIGPGHFQTIKLQSPGVLQWVFPNRLAEAVQRIATDCEKASEELERHFEAKKPQVYFRFNVSQGLQRSSMEEWEKLSEVTAHTHAYLRQRRVGDTLGEVVDRLWQNDASLPMFTSETLVEILPKST